MAIEKKTDEEHENEERWLLTYSDLITLLMVFFVVMYAMSKADEAKFQQMAETLKAAFSNPMGSQSGFESRLPTVRNPLAALNPESEGETAELPKRGVGGGVHRHSEALERLRRRFEEMLQRTATLGGAVNVSMNRDETALVVRLSDSLLFNPGSAKLTDNARALLDKVAVLLLSTDKPIRVEGHTDNIPIHNAKYQSNWELSTARAVNVLRYLIDAHHFPPERLSAGGYGQYRPIVPNDTPEHRAMNRRVEFVILDSPTEEDKTAPVGSGSSAAVTSPPTAETPAPSTSATTSTTSPETSGTVVSPSTPGTPGIPETPVAPGTPDTTPTPSGPASITPGAGGTSGAPSTPPAEVKVSPLNPPGA